MLDLLGLTLLCPVDYLNNKFLLSATSIRSLWGRTCNNIVTLYTILCANLLAVCFRSVSKLSLSLLASAIIKRYLIMEKVMCLVQHSVHM